MSILQTPFHTSLYQKQLYHSIAAEERYKKRLVKIKLLLDELFARLETVQVSGKSALAKAVRYALHEKPYFYTFLQDGNVPPDNNRAENAIRPFAISRKNWLFSYTAERSKSKRSAVFDRCHCTGKWTEHRAVPDTAVLAASRGDHTSISNVRQPRFCGAVFTVPQILPCYQCNLPPKKYILLVCY